MLLLLCKKSKFAALVVSMFSFMGGAAPAMACCNGHYVQPPRRESLRHPDEMCRPCGPIDACTVYRMSYKNDGCCNLACRPPLMRVHDNLKAANCAMDSNTTHRLSYRCPGPCAPPARVIPCDRNVIGEGPLSCLTTVRHDYGPKPIMKLAPIKPPAGLRCSNEPIEGVSVMSASYQPPCPVVPMRSYKPIQSYCPPKQPFERDTVNNMSYVPWPLKKKEHYPWACKGSYTKPCVPLECNSIYSASFNPPGQYMS